MPDGLVGFRSQTLFIELPDPEVAGLSWLQSVTSPELAFGLVPPPMAIGITGSSFDPATSPRLSWMMSDRRWFS